MLSLREDGEVHYPHVADALAVEDERRTDSYMIFTCIHSSGEIIVVVLFKERVCES
jgi:hypothetical protein